MIKIKINKKIKIINLKVNEVIKLNIFFYSCSEHNVGYYIEWHKQYVHLPELPINLIMLFFFYVANGIE
jgi:hypothetical protein